MPIISGTFGPYTSASSRPTLWPSFAMLMARFTATVLLPTPPFTRADGNDVLHAFNRQLRHFSGILWAHNLKLTSDWLAPSDRNPANSCRANLGNAAAAIMAALSVERSAAGKKNRRPVEIFSRRSQAAVAGDAARDDDRLRIHLLRSSGSPSQQLLNDGVLKARQQIESAFGCCGQPLLKRGLMQRAPRGNFLLHARLLFGPAQHGRLQAAEAEIEFVSLHLGERKFNGPAIAVRAESVDRRSARITIAEQLRDLVVSLSRRVVARFAQNTVLTNGVDGKQMRMPAAHNQRQGRELNFRMLQQHRVDVPLDMIHRDQRNPATRTIALSRR